MANGIETIMDIKGVIVRNIFQRSFRIRLLGIDGIEWMVNAGSGKWRRQYPVGGA
jgi:hypothetical protein